MLVNEAHTEYILTISSARWAKQSLQWLPHWFYHTKMPQGDFFFFFLGYLFVLVESLEEDKQDGSKTSQIREIQTTFVYMN